MRCRSPPGGHACFRFGAAGLFAALVVVVSGGALDQRGFYAPDGAHAIISLIVFLAWTLAASGFLVTNPPAEEIPEAAVPMA